MDTAAEEDQDARLIADMNLALSITDHSHVVTIERTELMRLLELVKQRSTSTPVLDTSFPFSVSGYDVEMGDTPSRTVFFINGSRRDGVPPAHQSAVGFPLPYKDALDLLVGVGILERTVNGARNNGINIGSSKKLMCRMTFSEMD